MTDRQPDLEELLASAQARLAAKLPPERRRPWLYWASAVLVGVFLGLLLVLA